MSNLKDEIAERTRAILQTGDRSRSVTQIGNDVIADADIEHVITFLEDSGSGEHRRLAAELRQVFEHVLRDRLRAIEEELTETPAGLYAALVDMYEVKGVHETLKGILTLNYDDYIEQAVEQLGFAVNYGITGPTSTRGGGVKAITILKLHGSFSWEHVWPIQLARSTVTPLWIPPGIQKEKGLYPFNVLWGRARELLDCDIVRIVGCNLSPNDWDLVSMLFSAQHAHRDGRPLQIEIIDKLQTAQRIKTFFPYLRPKSLLELDPIGPQLIAELTASKPREFTDLADTEVDDLVQRNGPDNPFWHWLKLKAEVMHRDLGNLTTSSGRFAALLES